MDARSSKQPRHGEVPPSLFFLPLPLPEPPKNGDYASILRASAPTPAPAEARSPPLYTEKVRADEALIKRASMPEGQAEPRK
jgi:hypothetical protein